MSTTPLKQVKGEKASVKAEPVRPLKSEASPAERSLSTALDTDSTAVDTEEAVRQLKRRRARHLARRAALGIGLPSLLFGVYYFFIASSQYESVSLFMVQSSESRGAVGLEMLIGAVPGAPATRDTLAVRDFILSRDMLKHLEETKALKQHYQQPTVDWFSRLLPDATSEEAFEYYRDMVQVDHDSNSGVLTLKVRAFSTKYAHELSQAVLSHSEQMVNKLSERARSDQTQLARNEVKKAEARLTQARQAIVELQQEHAEFSPEKTATEALSLRGELKAALAQARAELMEAKAFMQPNAPKVVALTHRVNSLSTQVAEESRRLVNPKDEKGLNTSMAQFEAALVEKEFAQSAYESALASLEVARSEAMRQHRYLATIAKPSAPNAETHPRRLRAVITVVLLSAMLLGIFSLLVAAVREHARI